MQVLKGNKKDGMGSNHRFEGIEIFTKIWLSSFMMHGEEIRFGREANEINVMVFCVFLCIFQFEGQY